MRMNKKRIDVIYKLQDNDRYIPVSIKWKDRVYDVERVLHSCRSVNGEYTGRRYTVVIGGEEKYLYRDGEEWYVDLLWEGAS